MGAEVETSRPRAHTTRFPRETGLLVLAVLLALALRGLRLDFQPLWWDEGYSVWFATHTLGQMAALTAEDIHPPLYYALLRGWIVPFGAGSIALRLLSVVFGALAIPAIYLAGRRLFPRGRVPLLAACLLAINPLHIFYSQEVRMYGLVALLSTGVVAAAWRIMEPGFEASAGLPGPQVQPAKAANPTRHLSIANRTPYITYILLTTLALYTQYYAVFVPAGITLYALWRWRRNGRALAGWLGAQAAVALLYLPWALYAAPRLIPYISQKVVADADRPLGIVTYSARHLAAFIAGHLEGPLSPWWPTALALLLPIALGLGLLLFRSQTARHAPGTTHHALHTTQSAIAILATLLLTALALGWLISLRAPFFPERGERLLILALPPFVLLAAAGLDALWRRWRVAAYVTSGLLVAASAASLAMFYGVPRYADDDYRPLIARAVEQGLPGDTFFCIYPWQVGYWRSYARAEGPTPLLSPALAWRPAVTDALDTALAQGRVWFPAHLALGAILENRTEAHLAGSALAFLNEWHGPNTRLSAWASTETHPIAPVGAAAADGLPIRYAPPGGGALVLEAVAGSTRPVPAANAITALALHWQAEAAPPILAVSVRLTDDLGQIWAQHDYEPLGGPGVQAGHPAGDAPWRAADRLGLLVPAGMPPGRYHVELVIEAQGAALPLEAKGADGRSLGPAVALYDLEIAPAGGELSPARLPIATRRTVDLADGLRFLGHSFDPAPLVPGELRKVSLFWQSWDQPAEDYVAFVQLLGRDGPVALWEAPPGAAYRTSAWTPGTLMRSQASLRVPAAAADGRYRLIAGLFRSADKTRLLTRGGADHVALGTVMLRGRPHRMTPPTPEQPADAVFGSVARLVGYDLEGAGRAIRPGTAFTLTLHWQALSATDRPYTIFVHLVDAEGAVRGYGDAEPGGGAFPTPGWLAGEYVEDAHIVTLLPDAAPGRYQVAVGCYDPATGERLQTPEGADRVVLERTVEVE